MPSTTSLIAGLEMTAIGEAEDTWGAKNNNNLQLLESLATGVSSLAVSDSGTTTVSLTNFTRGDLHNIGYKLTGTLTAARTVEFPAKPKLFAVHNATSGGYAVNVRIAGGSTISVANGAKALFMSDGSSLVAIANDALGGASGLAIAGESITSGTVPIARLPVASSGTSSTSLIVRSDDSRLTNDRTPADASVTVAKLAAAVMASQSEASAGTENTKIMTALRTAQYVAAINTFYAPYSAEFVIPPAGPGTTGVAHGLASEPTIFNAILLCKNSDAGYVAGDLVDLRCVGNLSTTTQPALYVMVSDGAVYLRRPSSSGLTVPNKSSFSDTPITTTNWRVLVTLIDY